jgi:16S rRNA (adenine1518-N6/adenine1519-N6)-dimethyltransferase
LSSQANFPKKRLGQHFLKDPNTARLMVAGVTAEDVVLEIGPGRGFLTAFLAQRAHLVHGVELDPDVLPALRQAVRDHGNVRIHEGDALRFDYGALDPAPNRLVANLPYNVASPLVLRLLEEVDHLDPLRFMVQMEVARRMAAERGTKDYAAYTVLVGLLARASIAHKVSPNFFDPPPRVYSAVVDMERLRPGLEPAEYWGAKEVVVSAFRSRRKRLINNLPDSLRGKTAEALGSMGFGPDTRAEELKPEDFVALYRAISGSP